MSALKPYPHYEINVKDNSIYRFAVDEILPVHRPLWILATQEGPVGDPVWCPTASTLKKKFGEQTLNLANKNYASIQSFFLNQTMSYDGAFIVRALPANAQVAAAILYAEVTENAEIVQYEIDNDETSVTYGERKVDLNAESDSYGKFVKKTGEGSVESGIKITFKIYPAEYDSANQIQDLSNLKPIPGANDNTTLFPILAVRALNPGSYGNELAFRFFYKDSENSSANAALYKTIFNCFTVARREYNSTTTDVIFDIYGRKYTTFSADPDCSDPESGIKMDMDSVVTEAFDVDNSDDSEFPFIVYTYEENIASIGSKIIAVEKQYDSAKRSLAYEEFGYKSADEMSPYQINILSGTNIRGVPYDHVAIAGRVDEEPEYEYTYAKTEDIYFVDDKEYFKQVPIAPNSTNYVYVKLVKGIDYVVGDPIVTIAFDDPNTEANEASSHNTEVHVWYEPTADTVYVANKTYYQKDGSVYTAVDAASIVVNDPIDGTLYERFEQATMPANVYERTEIYSPVYSYDNQTERVILDSSIDVYLQNGTDGDLDNVSEQERDNFVDKFTWQFLKLKINPKIVDKFRYPITHIYDPGFSMTTKYALIDFLDVRDDVAIELSTQSFLPNKWATGANTFAAVRLNDQARDIELGMILRERALLMRESVLKGTDCMRATIFPQAGKPVATAAWTKPVPFTLWSAVKHAMYGNTDQMSVQEPRGLPYSYNEMFKAWNWINYSELLKEKTWNGGLNYCQYADMKRIFYPALRTVYREETSVLTDQWVVDALVYTKHECRKAWARFSGRNDKQAIIEAAIKSYLDNTLSYLYNGKYDFDLSTYKTEEEQKLGYIEHVKLRLTFPATMRVINFDIEVNREGYNPESEG